jgi:hypothetical protein
MPARSQRVRNVDAPVSRFLIDHSESVLVAPRRAHVARFSSFDGADPDGAS